MHWRSVPALAWLAAGVVLFAASIVVYWHVIASQPGLWTHTDEWVYRAAGSLTRRHPGLLYRRLFGEPGKQRLPFAYPPFAALVFAAFSPLPFGAWQMAMVVLDLILLPVIVFASLRMCGRHGLHAVALALALAAVAIWLEPVYMTMFFGQVNLILLALITVDLSLPDSSKWKGIGIGIAAGVKLTPLIFIVYLLASRRIRAAMVSLVCFTATVAIGFAALPVASLDYWGSTFPGPEVGAYRLQNQSINGVILRLLHGQPPARTVWLMAAVAILAFGWATAVVASLRGHELPGIVLCGVTALLVSPISWSHHWVWAVPGLALMAAGVSRGAASRSPPAGIHPYQWAARAVGAAAILALFVMWPVPARSGRVTGWPLRGVLRLAPHNGQEYTWHGATLLLGNSYVAAGLAAIAGAAVYLWVTRRPFRGVPTAHATDDQVTSAPQRPPAGSVPHEMTGLAVPATTRRSARDRS